MTNAFLRAKNQSGKWDAIEVEHLTDAQREELFLGREPAELVRWLNVVCNTLQTAEAKLFEFGILPGAAA